MGYASAWSGGICVRLERRTFGALVAGSGVRNTVVGVPAPPCLFLPLLLVVASFLYCLIAVRSALAGALACALCLVPLNGDPGGRSESAG